MGITCVARAYILVENKLQKTEQVPPTSNLKLVLPFFFFSFERERERVREGQREKERENLKQASRPAQSQCGAQSHNPEIMT